MNMEFQTAYKQEGYGEHFNLGIEIRIAGRTEVTDGVKKVSYKAAQELEQQIIRDFYAQDKGAQERARLEKAELLALFQQPIYTEEIPNGYCGQACCEHRPWFIVTTRIGRIKIGWRKRVISIDWSDTPIRKNVTNDDVTRADNMVHAWSLEDAGRYLAELFNVPA